MPFGVTNDPLQFMRMMDEILSSYLDDFVPVFLDNILVYSRTVEQHVDHLGKVLEVLNTYCLFAKASKCSITVREVEFLGQWIMPQGVAPTKEKMKAITEWETPKTLREPGHFLGSPTPIAALFLDMRSWHPP